MLKLLTSQLTNIHAFRYCGNEPNMCIFMARFFPHIINYGLIKFDVGQKNFNVSFLSEILIPGLVKFFFNIDVCIMSYQNFIDFSTRYSGIHPSIKIAILAGKIDDLEKVNEELKYSLSQVQVIKKVRMFDDLIIDDIKRQITIMDKIIHRVKEYEKNTQEE